MDAPTRRLLIAVQFCFGVFPLLGKVAMTDGFAPTAVLAWRLLAGASVLLLVALRMHGRRAIPAPKDLAAILGLSLLGITLNQWLFLEGLHRSTSVNAGLIMTFIPVATLLVAMLVGQERPTGRHLAGIGLSVAGVIWLFLGREASLGGDTATGDALMLANCFSYSVYLVLAKPVLRRQPQIVVIAWMFVFGAAIAPWFALDVAWMPAGATTIQWWALAGVLLLPTVLAYVGNIVVLSRTEASTTAVYVMMQPFIAATLGITLLGERPEPAILPTAVLVIAGLWLVTTGGRAGSRRSH